jgi:hypothetical protein
VKILDAAGQKVAAWRFNAKYVGVLPDTLREYTENIPVPLSRGSYRARVEIDYGGPALVVGERSFDVP